MAASAAERPGYRWDDWKSTIICTALAILASAVFFWQVTRDTSFLSGVLGVEYRRLMPPAKGHAREDGGPTWTTVYEDFKSKLETQPYYAKHNAVGQLLHAVVEVERGRLKPEGIIQAARQVEATDADNWISRLALATLVDSTLRDRPAAERFEAVRQIVEAQPLPTTSILYNWEYERLWCETLERYIKRLDVRANLAQSMEHGEIHDHYSALAIIQNRLGSLCQTGQPTSVQKTKCQDWLLGALNSLLDSDPDPGTFTLCIDLMLKSLPSASPAAADLQKLRKDLRQRAGLNLPDFFDPSHPPSPMTDLNYPRLLRLAVLIAIAVASAVGAVMVLALSCIGALFSTSQPGTRAGWNLMVVLKVVLGVALISVIYQISDQTTQNLFSERACCLRLIGAISLGVGLPFLLLKPPEKPIRIAFPAAMLALALAMLGLSPDYLARFMRFVDLHISSLATSVIVLVILTLAAVALRPGPLWRLARAASIFWAVAISLALAGLFRLNTMDDVHQIAHSAGRHLGIESRLGINWRSEYRLSAPSTRPSL